MEKTDKLFKDLVLLIRTLRGEGGCPWDRKQTIETLKHYLYHEFQELMEALIAENQEMIKQCLGKMFLNCANLSAFQKLNPEELVQTSLLQHIQ